MNQETRNGPDSPRIQVSALPTGPNRASDEAQRYLKSLIFTRQLVPGDRLPPGRELSGQLGIAPVTLQVALRALEAEGFLVIVRGSKGGPRVSSEEALRECWLNWANARTDEVRGLLDFYAIVQRNIAVFAAQRRTSEDLDALEALLHFPGEGSSSVVAWHLRYEDALARAARNHKLRQSLRESGEELFVPVVGPDDGRHEQENLHFRERMFVAVRDRDAARAVEVMEAHTTYVQDIILKHPDFYAREQGTG